MPFHLLYDADQQELLQEKVLPLLEDIGGQQSVWDGESFPEVSDGDDLLLFLSDQQIEDGWSALVESAKPIALLPHPDAKQICAGLGVGDDLEKAVEHILEQKDPVEMDVLYANDRPVFNHLVMGHEFQLTTSSYAKSSWWGRRLYVMIAKFFRLKPFDVEIELKDDQKIQTAVAGIVITQHRKGLVLSRLVDDPPSFSDGMMHAFLICPRSLVQLMAFAIRSLWEKRALPSFGAHIKTDRLVFRREGEGLEFAQDGATLSSQEVALKVERKQVSVFPGRKLEVPEQEKQGEEVFRTGALPLGEAAAQLASKRLPLIRRASFDEFKELFKLLRENARTRRNYLVLMVLSTVLATFGLFGNSAPVVIGAMILAPLMAPVISLSMATLRQDRELAWMSFRTILAGLLLSFLFAVAITLVTPLNFPNEEILSRTRPNLLDLGIAVVSGIAGAYAHAREEIAKTLAGVAIAVALVPPLAVSAIGLGWGDWSIFSGSALLLFTNLAGMVLAAAFTFLLLGFSPLRLATRGMMISLVIVLVLSVPLWFGFRQMVEEHRVIQRLDGWQTESVIIKDVQVQRLDPLTIDATVVSTKPLSSDDLHLLIAEMEEQLQQDAVFEITVATRH